MSRRVMGAEEVIQWLAQAGPLLSQVARVFIKPNWVGILDYESYFTSAIVQVMEQASGHYLSQ